VGRFFGKQVLSAVLLAIGNRLLRMVKLKEVKITRRLFNIKIHFYRNGNYNNVYVKDGKQSL